MIRTIITALVIAMTVLGFGHAAVAQDNGTAAGQTELRSLIQKVRQKTMKLQRIHAEVLKSSPELRRQQEQFIALLHQTIKDQGYDIEAGRERVSDLAQKLKSGDLSDSERRNVKQNIAAERQSLRQARVAALRQPEVREAARALQEATLTAMKAENPQVGQLIEELNRLRQQLRAAAQKAMMK